MSGGDAFGAVPFAAIHPPDTAGAILECLGLPARPPPVALPRRAVAPWFEPDPDWSRD